jgi:hypothetical protein
LSLRPAHHKKTPQDPEDFGKYVKKPPVDELKRMAQTMTTAEMAVHYGTSAKRCRDWLYRSGLRAVQKCVQHIPGSDELIRRYKTREACADYIKSTEWTVAEAEFGVQPQAMRRWQHKYGARFRRRCMVCLDVFDAEAMHYMPQGCSDYCRDCWKEPKRKQFAKQNYLRVTHHERVDHEYASAPLRTARVALSKAQDINGFWLVQGAGHE